MNSSYAPLVLIGAMFAMAAYAAISAGPDDQTTPSKSPAASQQAAAAASPASNDDEGAVEAVWEEVKEAGRETADFFTSDDSSQQAARGDQGQTSQGNVKVYTTQGQEVGAITAIILNHENDGVSAIVISPNDADSGSSNQVDEKLRTALCGDRAQ